MVSNSMIALNIKNNENIIDLSQMNNNNQNVNSLFGNGGSNNNSNKDIKNPDQNQAHHP